MRHATRGESHIPCPMYHVAHGGFTLLEMLVSIGIFSVLIVSSIAVILSIGSAQTKTSNVQNIQDNMRYTMELMSREMRQGKNYQPFLCVGDVCEKIKFTKFEDEPDPGDDEVPVWYCSVVNDGVGEIRRWKQETDECQTSENAEVLTGREVDIRRLYFVVVGDDAESCIQPRVTILLEGRSEDAKTELESEFHLQTTVTQRIRKIVDPQECED